MTGTGRFGTLHVTRVKFACLRSGSGTDRVFQTASRAGTFMSTMVSDDHDLSDADRESLSRISHLMVMVGTVLVRASAEALLITAASLGPRRRPFRANRQDLLRPRFRYGGCLATLGR